jgi:hypothetical protein
VLLRPSVEGVPVGNPLRGRVDRDHARSRDERAEERSRDPHPHRGAFQGALCRHPVVGELAQIAHEHPRAAPLLLGEAHRVHNDQLAELAEHGLGQELQEVLGLAPGVHHQGGSAIRCTPEEVDGLDQRLLDQHDPIRMRVLVDEFELDWFVGEARVLANQAVGAVGVVHIVTDELGVEPCLVRRRGDAVRDVPGFLVHDDAPRPDAELVVHHKLHLPGGP